MTYERRLKPSLRAEARHPETTIVEPKRGVSMDVGPEIASFGRGSVTLYFFTKMKSA
jgi:hypothetical protein